MSMEFQSPKRKIKESSKIAAKERRAEQLLSQTQEEAEAIRSQDRERINASRELESQEETEVRRGHDRDRTAAVVKRKAKRKQRQGEVICKS
jgi:hypothetical protein